MSMKRFQVAGHSMTPTLRPGDEVVATDARRALPGELVVFEHPNRADLWLIKRLVDAEGWVISDNAEVGDSDSRTLGPLPADRLLPVVERLDTGTFEEACALLAAEDDNLGRLIDRWGLPDFWHRQPGFPTLVLLILEQQVSLESGAAMYRRLAKLVGDVTAETVAAAGAERLRSIGVTRQKTAYLLELGRRILEDDLNLDALEVFPAGEARDVLLSIKGVGPWTADAYLLSVSRRPDMWPVGDRALQVGTAEALGMATPPDEEQLEIIAEPWRPIRAAAARLIWHAYLSTRGRVEPPNPIPARARADEA